MQEEQNNQQEREEQNVETELPAQFARRRAETLQEHFPAYRNALRSDPQILRLSTLDMNRPLEERDDAIPFHLYQNTKPGYDLDWALQEMSPHHPAISRADQRQFERWARSPLAPEQALRLYKHCVIVGAPGTGKTTMLKYLTLQSIGQQLKGLPDLPIHVDLPAFARSGHRDLLEYVSVVWQERSLWLFSKRKPLTTYSNDYTMVTHCSCLMVLVKQEQDQHMSQLRMLPFRTPKPLQMLPSAFKALLSSSLPAKHAPIFIPTWMALQHWRYRMHV
jgi:hypothetical protein